MNDHAIKALFATLAGFYAGIPYIIQVDPSMGGWMAIGRSLLVGGAAWIGQSAAKYAFKYISLKWKNRKKK